MTPFELAVVERVILDVHRQALGLRIERRPLRHRPRQQHAVVLEPEVVVQVAGEMLLHAEEPLAPLSPGLTIAGGLGRLGEVALSSCIPREAMAGTGSLDVSDRYRTSPIIRLIGGRTPA